MNLETTHNILVVIAAILFVVALCNNKLTPLVAVGGLLLAIAAMIPGK